MYQYEIVDVIFIWKEESFVGEQRIRSLNRVLSELQQGPMLFYPNASNAL